MRIWHLSRDFTHHPLPAALIDTSDLSLFRFFYPFPLICLKYGCGGGSSPSHKGSGGLLWSHRPMTGVVEVWNDFLFTVKGRSGLGLGFRGFETYSKIVPFPWSSPTYVSISYCDHAIVIDTLCLIMASENSTSW